MLFNEYKQNVILAYHDKRKEGLLSLHLEEPTPASLRNECFKVLSDRYLKKDEKTLRLFFDIDKESNDYYQAIEWCKTDKFKPLFKFLKGATTDTEKKNIELLAWLIDFEERPFKSLYITDSNKSDQESRAADTSEVIEGPHVLEEIVEPPIITPNKTDSGQTLKDGNQKTIGKWIPKKSIISITILILFITGAYLYMQQTTVYICNRGTGRKYHLNPNCSGMNGCGNGITQTTIASAEKNGKTLCGLENYKPLSMKVQRKSF